MKKVKINVILALCLILTVSVSCHAQKKNQKSDNGKTAKVDVKKDAKETTDGRTTLKQLVSELRTYVEKEQKKNNGYFHVYDKKQHKKLSLKLEKFEADHISPIGNDTYFMCSDFKGKDGKMYDVDLFMKHNKDGSFQAKRKVVHKVNGDARYYWYKDKKTGKWKTKSAGKGTEGPEHPRH